MKYKLSFVTIGCALLIGVMTFATYAFIARAADTGDVFAGTGTDDAGIGTTVWSNTSSISASDDVRAVNANGTLCANDILTSIKLIKGGSIAGNDKATSQAFTTLDTTVIVGADGDLWGVALTPTDVNASNFGFAASASGNTGVATHYLDATNFGFSVPVGATITGVKATMEGGCSTATIRMDAMSVTVYYTVAAGAAVASSQVQISNGNLKLGQLSSGNNIIIQ